MKFKIFSEILTKIEKTVYVLRGLHTTSNGFPAETGINEP